MSVYVRGCVCVRVNLVCECARVSVRVGVRVRVRVLIKGLGDWLGFGLRRCLHR